MLTTLVRREFGLITLVLTAFLAGSLQAQVEPDRSGVGQAEFRLAELTIENEYREPRELPAQAAANAAADLAALGPGAKSGHIDVRGGRWATLLMSEPLVPGRGQGNGLSWAKLGRGAPSNEAQLAQAAGQAFKGYLESNSHPLRIDPYELVDPGKVAVHQDGAVIQIYMPRVYEGIRVRGSHLTATINHGNLTLFSAENWGDITASTTPGISKQAAMNSVRAYVEPYPISGEWGKGELVLVPLARGQSPRQVAVGQGFDYRLAWAIRPAFDGDQRRFEALVDARTGQLLSFEDTNQYAEAKGGVYPKTNDGVGEDGTEQVGWPMPWMEVGSQITDTGGNYNLAGSQTARFYGPYVNMADNCGTDSLTQSGGIDWGFSDETDCTTPGFGGAGNTHASRSGFYELNRIKEMARSHLPSNTWLQGRLTANMNIDDTCNAFWNGSTVNFYRSGGGCANTGEIAAVFDHEWGHGMDANDVAGGIANPSGEGIADIYSALRLYDSCIGRNFLPTPCGGNGDPCLSCTGVRDIDYLQRQSGQPHDYSWSNANCGNSVHCKGGVYSEAVWSLWKRKLQAAPYSYDNNTAAEIVTRLTYIAAGLTSTWFSGSPPNGGCGGSSGYMNYLAADDDNGNLNDGTPHMTAIYDAFNDQEIACGTPTVQDSGCSGTPTTAPNVTTTSGNTSINLSWGAVTGASSYEVFRAEGIYKCDFGKVKIASSTDTSFTDSGLQNGRDYSYVVIPKGPSASCFGPASACATDQPGKIACSVAADCDDGAFCNGAETCAAGFCAAAADACAVTPTWTCDEAGDVCVPECTVDADCNDGAFCNGAEVCNAGTCGPGSDPCPGQSCDESVNVCTDTNGPQIAVYDAGLGAPKCAIRGSSCDSTTLVDGRGNKGPEPNQPNTLDNCADGAQGTYHSDESNDRILVSSVDGRDFTEGVTVQVDATVWAWSTGSSDTLDLYYAADANNPDWTYITSIAPSSGGANTLSARYTLPAGSLQAVRANFRYGGSQSSCSSGNYDEADDLVFTVDGGIPACVVDADCGNGSFCDGAETCNAGSCQAGTPPVCDDGLFCNGTGTCNEGTDSCDPGTPPSCDNGLYCDGTESCNEGTDSCDAGTPVDCDDGVGCTDDSCNEGSDSCDNVPNDELCADDNEFCTGAEFCDPSLDCQSAGDPCASGATCDEAENVCEVTVCDNDGVCEIGENCNNCANDCIGGTIGAVCGNNICEAGSGENASNCSADCNGVLNGKPSNRYSCGADGLSCSDPLCTGNGNTCTDDPTSSGENYCCGDAVCEGDENLSSCALDCSAPNEAGLCVDGIDNDGDSAIDCADADCFDDTACNSSCLPSNVACELNDECCSGNCRTKGKKAGTCS